MTLRCTSPVYARTYFLDASTEELQTQDAANVGDMNGFRLMVANQGLIVHINHHGPTIHITVMWSPLFGKSIPCNCA